MTGILYRTRYRDDSAKTLGVSTKPFAIANPRTRNLSLWCNLQESNIGSGGPSRHNGLKV